MIRMTSTQGRSCHYHGKQRGDVLPTGLRIVIDDDDCSPVGNQEAAETHCD